MISQNNVEVLSKEEKDEILRNAYSSFQHGVDHFSKFADGENNIKFAIIHIFNTIELLMKAYLGSINLHLLILKIDDDYNSTKPTADISVLLKRMKNFSSVNFNQQLQDQIEELRKSRNDIEHKRFIIKDDTKILLLLCEIINGLVVFSKNYLNQDICTDLITGTKKKFDSARIKIDPNFADKIKRMEEFKNDGYSLTDCPYCLNTSVPYKKESIAKCFICESDVYIHKCELCSNLFVFHDGYPGHCGLCEDYPTDEEVELLTSNDNSTESWDSLAKENY
ncbi:MAG: hypothetical protein AAB386_00545 [Patescibacteria group bacterium]